MYWYRPWWWSAVGLFASLLLGSTACLIARDLSKCLKGQFHENSQME